MTTIPAQIFPNFIIAERSTYFYEAKALKKLMGQVDRRRRGHLIPAHDQQAIPASIVLEHASHSMQVGDNGMDIARGVAGQEPRNPTATRQLWREARICGPQDSHIRALPGP